MSTIRYTADLHLGHALVARTRGFDDPEPHDAMVIEMWNQTVDKNDIIYVLGDISCGREPYALTQLSSLPGRKRLIVGNHDSVHPMHRESHKRQRQFLEVFESVQTFARRRAGGVEFLLSHFPYDGDHTETERFNQYRLRDEGRWLLHGHTHSTTARSSERGINVGLDAWGMKMVSEPVLLEMMT